LRHLPRSPLDFSGIEVPRLCGFGTREGSSGFPVPAQQERGHAEIPPCRRVAWFDSDRLAVCRHGLLVPSHGIEDEAEVVARIGIDGADLRGSRELSDRSSPGAKMTERDPEVVVGVRVVWVDAKRLAIRLCGLVPPMQVCERRAQTRVDRGNARGKPCGFSESPCGVFVATATHQLQAFVVAGGCAFVGLEVRTGGLITGLERCLPVSRDAA
jgi:hypothetical protein